MNLNWYWIVISKNAVYYTKMNPFLFPNILHCSPPVSGDGWRPLGEHFGEFRFGELKQLANCLLQLPKIKLNLANTKRNFANQWHWDKTSVVKPGLTIRSSIKHTYPEILTNSTKCLEKAISIRYPKIFSRNIKGEKAKMVKWMFKNR